MIEKTVKDVRGFFLYDSFLHKYFFRVYDEKDKTKFTDYNMFAEEIEVTIHEGGLSLYDFNDTDKNNLDWSSRILGKCKSKEQHPQSYSENHVI